jgi:hypothetical protein
MHPIIDFFQSWLQLFHKWGKKSVAVLFIDHRGVSYMLDEQKVVDMLEMKGSNFQQENQQSFECYIQKPEQCILHVIYFKMISYLL